SGDHDEIGKILLCEEYFRRYGKKIRDGWMLSNFSQEKDGMRIRAFISMITLDVVMIISFSIAITLAGLTYHYISLADTKFIGHDQSPVQAAHCCLRTDYREGVISLVRKKKVIDTKTTVWKTVSTAA
ncbi:hypothetical protein PMAYCL1PPCAC_17014, partial [Pristionchus mayeri]